MSGKEDVFAEHALRSQIQDVLDSYRQEVNRLAMRYGRLAWPPAPMQWEEQQAVRLLGSNCADDIIEVMQQCQKT